MTFKISEISTRKLRIWRSLNAMLSVFTLLFLLYLAHYDRSPHTFNLIWYLYSFLFFLILLSSVFYFYAYDKSKKFSSKNIAVKVPLPVTNKRMKILWISMNLLGLTFFLVALFLKLSYVLVLIFLALGAISMASSNVFKRYAYKSDNYNRY